MYAHGLETKTAHGELPHLRPMLVTGVEQELPLSRQASARRTNKDLQDARGLDQLGEPKSAPSRRPGPKRTGVGKGAPSSVGQSSAAAPPASGPEEARRGYAAGRLDMQMLGSGGRNAAGQGASDNEADIDGLGVLDDVLAEDAAEIVAGTSAQQPGSTGDAGADVIADGSDVESSPELVASDVAPDVPGELSVDAPRAGFEPAVEDLAAEPSAPPPPPAPESFIKELDENGYVHDSPYHGGAARITPRFGTSVAVKCYVHTGCSCAMAEWKLPSLGALRSWIATAERPQPETTPEYKKRMAAAHARAMKALAAEAISPGRSRQDLIAAAAAADNPSSA